MDTSAIKHWGEIESEFEIVLKKIYADSCLKPSLSFYREEYSGFVLEHLERHIAFRAMPYPPPPNIYETDGYLVIGWNWVDHDGWTCCACDGLLTVVKNKLGLTELEPPSSFGWWHEPTHYYEEL